MRARSALVGLVLVGLLTGCSRLPGASDAPEAAPTPPPAIVPEERSTCEALTRVDLAVVSDQRGDLARSAAALDLAARRAPAAIAPNLATLAEGYGLAAEYPDAVAALSVAPDRGPVLAWFATRCPGLR